MQSSVESSIKQFYNGTEIFITGGSGYIGKVLIEKLLRSCPGVKTLYLLLRPKKGMSNVERISKFSDNMLFETLKKTNPKWMEKIHVIEGDAKDLNLSISESDRQKLKTCSVIFHAAASVRFDDSLQKAILLNMRGTREVCELARTMPNLKAFIHVSTAYIQPYELHVEEIIYPAKADWRTYIDFAEQLDPELLNHLSEKLMDFAPNTYVFSKHLAEHICNDYKNQYDLPIALYRPSVVTSTEIEPLVGWTDNINGFISLILMSSLGITHVNDIADATLLNFIPVDICVKGMMIAAFKIWNEKAVSVEIPVYNAASVKCLTAASFFYHRDFIEQYPSQKAITPICMIQTTVPFFGWILKMFLNVLPALILDGFLSFTSVKISLLKIQRVIFTVEKAVRPFTNRTFSISNFKFNDLNLAVPEHERKDFFINETMDNFTLARVTYVNSLKEIMKEDPNDLPKARRRYFYLRMIFGFAKFMMYYYVYRILNRVVINLMN